MRREEIGGVRAARMIDVSPQCWYTWLNGQAVPTRRKSKHLATLLSRSDLSPEQVIALIDADRTYLAARRAIARAAASADAPSSATIRIQHLPDPGATALEDGVA